MHFRIYFLALLLAGGFVSCSSYQNVTAPTIENISGFQFGKFENGKIDISFTTQLKNPDLLKFRIKKSRLDLLIGETKIGEVHSKRTIRIKRELKPEVQWIVTADLKSILQKPGALFGGLLKGKTELHLKGDITVAKFLFSRTVPVDLKAPVQLPSFF